jgi:hypothetical protein
MRRNKYYIRNALLALSAASTAFMLSLPVSAQSLSFSFTNTIFSENQDEQPNVARVHIPATNAFDLSVELSVTDPTEILIPTGVTIQAGSVSKAFFVSPIADSEIDGTLSVSLIADAVGYGSATGTIEVADSGGFIPRLDFSSASQLEHFTLIASNLDLGGPVDDNFSASVILQSTGELMILLNRSPGLGQPPRIQVYNTNGVYQRTVTMTGFNDAEGMCRVTNDVYAICEEGFNDDITLVTITPATTTIAKGSGQILSVTLPFGKLFNKGMEGVTYDVMNHCFYVVQEAFPMGVYRIRETTNGVATDVLFDAESIFSGLATDLSELTYDPYSGHLFILSDEGNRIFECTMTGEIVDTLPLIANQAEGLNFFADEQMLFIVSEPNHGFWYRRNPIPHLVYEGTNETFEVGLSRPMTNAVTLDLSTLATGATPVIDFSPTTGNLAIATGQTTESFSITIIEDGVIPEPDESFFVRMTNLHQGVTAGPNLSLLFTILGTPHTVDVYSPYGTPSPPLGSNFFSHTAVLTGFISDSPLVLPGGTQLVCKGWIGTGSVPSQGSGTSTPTFTVTNSSSIFWIWTTNVWLGATVLGGGQIVGGNQWLPLNTNVTITAVTNQYFEFEGWSGDVSGADTNQLQLPLLMDRSRDVSGAFSAFLATNDVPLWWLAQYYGPTANFDVVTLSDSDLDGFSTWQEYISDTNPTNAESFLQLNSISRISGELSLGWPGSTARIYTVYGGGGITNLPAAMELTNGLPGMDAPETTYTTYTTPSTSPAAAFFWIEANLP